MREDEKNELNEFTVSYAYAILECIISIFWGMNLDVFHVLNGLGASYLFSSLIVVLNDNEVARFLILSAPYAYYWFRWDRDAEIERKLILGLTSVLLAIIVARWIA